MKLELVVDRIVLDGPRLPPAEIRRLRRTLERELGRLLGELASGALPERGFALASVKAPPLAAAGSPGAGAELGRSLARSIHAALAPQLNLGDGGSSTGGRP